MTGDYQMGIHWRWSQKPEALMLDGLRSEKLAASVTNAVSKTADNPGQKYALGLATPEWPGFRGADRAARALGPRISTNWAAHPPRAALENPGRACVVLVCGCGPTAFYPGATRPDGDGGLL